MYYEPNDYTIENFENQTYEMIFEKKREALEKEYITALNKKPMDTTKKIINLLETEYVLDYLLIYDLNPRMKLFTDANSFADAITNHTYFYTVNYELKKLEKTILPKKIGAGVKIGNITNNPFVSLKDVNQIADFPLEKLSYVWLSSDLDGEERLMVYTAEDSLKFPTYFDYKSQEDKLILEEIEKLRVQFSDSVGYDISKDYLKKIFQKLNYAIISPPIEFIEKYSGHGKTEIKPFTYQYKAILQKEEFEKELYIQLQESFTGKFKFIFVENLSGIYTKIGSKFLESEENFEVDGADFNVATNAAIIKKETFVSASMIENLRGKKEISKELIEKLPIPNVEVIFYFPAKEDISKNVKMYNGSSIEHLFDKLPNYEIDNKEKVEVKAPEKKINVEIQYIDKNGETIIPPTKQELFWDSKYSLDEFEYIVDNDGNTWKCRENLKESFSVLKNLKENVLILTYGIVKPNLKIIYNTIYGKNLKEELIMTYPNELYTVKDLPNLIDENGLLWKPQENIDSDIYINDDKINETIVTYDEAKQKVCIQYEDENHNKIREDKVFYEQVGKNFKVPLEKYYEDTEGCWWKLKECNRISFVVSENEEYNEVTVSYLPDYTDVVVVYQDLAGEEIRNRDTVKIQIGKKIDDVLKKSIKDRRGNIWNIVMLNYEPFVVKKDTINKVVYHYDIAKSEVEIRYCNLLGEFIKPTEKVLQQIGSGVVPSPELFTYDDEQRKWRLQKVEPALLKVKDEGNVITFWYQKANAEINLLFLDSNGNEIQIGKKDKAQIGTKYSPNVYEKTIYQSEQVWKLVDIKPEEILVKEDSQENEIHFIYEKDEGMS